MGNTPLPTLGFIGLGAMGGRMAKNLLRAGYPLVGFDINGERLGDVGTAGAQRAVDVDDVAQRSDIVLTSVSTSDLFVRLAENHLLPKARAGQIFIELGTTRAPDIRRLAARFAARGATLLDVPVTGWITGAEQGTLRMFVGGDEAVARRCWPIFEVLGDPAAITYCGPSGSGQVLKGVQQLCSGLATAAAAEALAFGVRSGVPLETVLQALGNKEKPQALGRKILAGDNVVETKFGELPYFLAEADDRGYAMPMTRALYEFQKEGEKVTTDGQGRGCPSYWRELMNSADQARRG